MTFIVTGFLTGIIGGPEPGQVAFFPVIDAIQEFKIESVGYPLD